MATAQQTPGPAPDAIFDNAPKKLSPDMEELSSRLDDVIDATIARQKQELIVEHERLKLNQRYAGLFHKSGVFQDLKGVGPEEAIARALIKIELGRELGIPAVQSMQSIYFVNGRPCVDAQIRATKMKKAGYTWKVKRLDDKGCVLEIFYKGTLQGESSFDEADANRAGLIQKTGSVYKPYPRNMYFARAITNAQRWYAPEAMEIDLLSREEAEEIEPERSVPAKPLFRNHVADRMADPVDTRKTDAPEPKPDPEPKPESTQQRTTPEEPPLSPEEIAYRERQAQAEQDRLDELDLQEKLKREAEEEKRREAERAQQEANDGGTLFDNPPKQSAAMREPRGKQR